MKKCPFCSAKILDDAEFCLYCMRQLTPKAVAQSNHKRKKSYWWIVLLSILLALIVCAAVILTIKYGANIDKKVVSSNNYSSDYSEAIIGNDEDVYDIAPEKETNGDTSKEDTVVGESVPATSSSSKVENPPKTPDSDETDGSNDTTTQASPNDDTKTENDNSTTITPSLPSKDPQPEATKQTWSVNEVDGGIEITGIENYNASGNYEIPSQINGKTVVGIGFQAFYYEQDLKSITLPVTLKYISEQAFANCNSLTEIVIPANVTEIQNNAFLPCKNLSDIYIKSTNVNIANYAFSTSYQRNVTLTIHAQSTVMDSMKARIYWDAEYEEWNG